jgi:hypothetical protein
MSKTGRYQIEPRRYQGSWWSFHQHALAGAAAVSDNEIPKTKLKATSDMIAFFIGISSTTTMEHLATL